jgi:hypothetical protein
MGIFVPLDNLSANCHNRRKYSYEEIAISWLS